MTPTRSSSSPSTAAKSRQEWHGRTRTYDLDTTGRMHLCSRRGKTPENTEEDNQPRRGHREDLVDDQHADVPQLPSQPIPPLCSSEEHIRIEERDATGKKRMKGMAANEVGRSAIP